MKACILFSGYLRTFNLNYNKLKETVLNQFDHIDIYFHITLDESADDKYLNNNDKDIHYIINVIKPSVLLIEKNTFKHDIYNLWDKYHKLNMLRTHYEKNNNVTYDIVIKIRPDMHILEPISFHNISQNTVYIPSDSKMDTHKLTNKNDKYICDIFAYGDSESMTTYFNLVSHIDKLTKKHGMISETILYHYLYDSDISVQLFDLKYNVILSTCNVFAICGDSGSGKTTLGNILKNIFNKSFIMECDRYHKWERNDPKWKQMTHLNPDANYIMKMSADIFDLKIGNDIYQIDYDHRNGKFTEKQHISTSDNIIVCGLHCLYSNTNEMFNVKIFIDTDDNLKIPWKIQRDMKKRNHTISDILKQINVRRDDYNKYILPQREQSDIIINFFTDESWDTNNNIYEDRNIYLRLYIKHSFSHISLLLDKYNIEYDIKYQQHFVSFAFKKYSFDQHLFKEISLNTQLLHNYYDIIIFFIFYISIH